MPRSSKERPEGAEREGGSRSSASRAKRKTTARATSKSAPKRAATRRAAVSKASAKTKARSKKTEPTSPRAEAREPARRRTAPKRARPVENDAEALREATADAALPPESAPPGAAAAEDVLHGAATPETARSEASPPPRQGIPPLPDVEDLEDEIVPFDEDLEPEAEAPPEATPTEILEAVQGGRLHVSALNRLSDDEVQSLARQRGIAAPPGERREETLYRVLQAPASAAAVVRTTFAEGLLELHPDGYGFLRRPERSYMQQPEDVYVAAGLIRRLGLRQGHWVSGMARRTRPDEPLLALHEVEEVNHESLSELDRVVEFESLTVVYPDQRFLLETRPEEIETRVMDLFCPLGRGQRALIVSPPRAGKTILLQKLADAIAHNSPNVDIVVLLVDERPEEVTNMRRSVRGEVVASTFDRPPSNHVRIAELVMDKVKRMVEFGRHVVLLLDSITRLGRAYNNMAGPSGRILTGGLEAKALTKPKRFFGAARNIEDGGSLTIVATALVDTGSRMDDVIFEEFKGSGNMEIVLDRDLANARIWPAIDIPASGTRNEDLLLHPEELRRINLLRKALSGRGSQGVMETLLEQMRQYRTNAELLMAIRP